MYISDRETLVSFCKRASASKMIAVDTEFMREKTYFPQLCLIQIATHDESAAIDPLLIDDLSSLEELLFNEETVKVFHSCTQDLEVIFHVFGAVPRPVFDTQVAAAFLGLRLQIGYGALVEAYCGVRLPKAESMTDWSARPLDAAQLAYAEDDVIYLPGIYDQMMAELVRKDRYAWVAPEMEALTDESRYAHDPSLAYLHLKRSSSLTRRQLAVAREVCAWRERLAAKRNLPRKWVASDDVLVEVSRRQPRTVENLRRTRGIDQLSKRDCEELLEAVRLGVGADPLSYPTAQHRDRPSGDMESVIDLAYALLRLVAEREGIAPQLIASREDLYDFARKKGDARLASGWRYEVCGKELRRLFSGEVGLTVKEDHIELL